MLAPFRLSDMFVLSCLEGIRPVSLSFRPISRWLHSHFELLTLPLDHPGGNQYLTCGWSSQPDYSEFSPARPLSELISAQRLLCCDLVVLESEERTNLEWCLDLRGVSCGKGIIMADERIAVGN